MTTPSEVGLSLRVIPARSFHLVTLNPAERINQMGRVTRCFHRKSSLPPSVYLKGWEAGRGGGQCIHTRRCIYLYTTHVHTHMSMKQYVLTAASGFS